MAILYADKLTGSMERMIEETNRRRVLQREYNEKHGIIPMTVFKSVEEIELSTRVADARTKPEPAAAASSKAAERPVFGKKSPAELLKEIEQGMRDAAAQLDFERAAILRDQYLELKAEMDGARPGPQRRSVSALRG
jgi:excinuclease ABC subunit B